MIYVSETLWLQMYELLAQTPGNVERVAFLDGVSFKTGGVVTTVTIPDAVLSCGGYEVSPEAMSQAGKHLRRWRMVRLAQVHTHPGEWVGHSPKDSASAYSQMPGAISIVVPRHGAARPRLCESGVHLRDHLAWRQLGSDEIASYIQVLPTIFDFRTTPAASPSKDITWNEYLIATRALLAVFLRRFLKRA